MKTHYSILSVEATASADDIKKAFRREIARYHPDKVQHLGKEFQDLAVGIAAELTEAYRVLMDPALRAEYDTGLAPGQQDPTGLRGTMSPPESQNRQTAAPPHPPPPERSPSSKAPRAAGFDVVRRATLARLTRAVGAVGEAQASPAPGFDAAYLIRPRKGLFKKTEPGVRLLIKVVPEIDTASVAECWPLALRAGVPETTPTLMMIGPSVAPARELSVAVTEQRRRARGAGPLLVPVDVRDWEALFPPETPESVRAIVKHLHAQR